MSVCFYSIPVLSGYRPLFPHLLLSLVLLAVAPRPAHAQTAESHKASCKVKAEEPTDVELAFARRDKNFAKIVAAALAKEPGNELYRELEVDYLLDSGQVEQATKEVDTWTAQSPNDAYAILTASEYRHTLGDWLESYVLAQRAIKADPCLAPAYADMAEFEEDAGYRLSAAKHLAIAHQLWPKDELIRRQWIYSLPEAQGRSEVDQLIADSKLIDDAHRKQVQDRVDLLEAHKQNRCELVAADGSARIPMVPIDQNGDRTWGVVTSLNGRQRTLLLDTGASGLLLTLGASANMQLTPVTTARVGGFGSQGSTATRIMVAASVKIGGLEFKNCPVETVSSYGSMGGSSMGMGQKLDDSEGLIGSDMFARYLVTLDYVKHEIRLAPLPENPATPVAAADRDPLGGSNNPDWLRVDRYVAPEMKSWTKIYRSDHLLVVPAALSNNDARPTPALFVADTGSFANMIDSNAIQAFTKVQDSLTYAQGMSGITQLKEAGSFTVDFAGIRLPVKSMDSTDLRRFGGPIGFLGQPTLEQLVMQLDYRDNLALFDAPSAKKVEAGAGKKM